MIVVLFRVMIQNGVGMTAFMGGVIMDFGARVEVVEAAVVADWADFYVAEDVALVVVHYVADIVS